MHIVADFFYGMCSCTACVQTLLEIRPVILTSTCADFGNNFRHIGYSLYHKSQVLPFVYFLCLGSEQLGVFRHHYLWGKCLWNKYLLLMLRVSLVEYSAGKFLHPCEICCIEGQPGALFHHSIYLQH